MNENGNEKLESPVAPLLSCCCTFCVRGKGRYSLSTACHPLSLTPKYLQFHILTSLKSRGILQSVACPSFVRPTRIMVAFTTDGFWNLTSVRTAVGRMSLGEKIRSPGLDILDLSCPSDTWWQVIWIMSRRLLDIKHPCAEKEVWTWCALVWCILI